MCVCTFVFLQIFIMPYSKTCEWIANVISSHRIYSNDVWFHFEITRYRTFLECFYGETVSETWLVVSVPASVAALLPWLVSFI